ncbi:hypothetical protein MPER_00843 [Moniliophthora perniciosa FA553]|nr:hypothetical protein MPER_00843 [Moniliophthora perniciosa FA553]
MILHPTVKFSDHYYLKGQWYQYQNSQKHGAKLHSMMHSTNQQESLAILQSKGPYTLINIPIPRPEKGEVLVKVQGAALNHLDWKLQYSPIDLFPFPLHTGSDGAGTVLEVKEGVSDVKEGDRM